MARLPLVFLLLGSLAPFGADGQEPGPAPVVATLEWEPGVPGATRARQVPLDADLPAGLEIPGAVQDGRHALVTFAANLEMAVVVDASSGRERIWLDHDFDGAVVDDPDSEFTKSGVQFVRKATLLVPFAGERQPVPVEVTFRCSFGGAQPVLTLTTSIHRVGEVVLGDRMRRLALTDESNHLRFDEGRSVVLLLDVDGDGTLAAPHGTHEHLHLGDDFRLGDEGWSFRIADPAGSRIEFVRLAEPPPAQPRAWNGPAPPPSPYRVGTPRESLEELQERFEQERGKTLQERSATLRLLGWTGEEGAYALLAETAEDDDEDERVRAAAVRAMGNEAYLQVHGEEVLEFARGEEPLLAAAAISALYAMGHPQLEAALLPLLESDEADVVAAAAQHLGYLGSEAGVAAVRELIEEHTDMRVRYQAYQGIRRGAAGPPPELALLCARDDYAFLRAMALQDLAALGHPERRALALEAVRDATTQVALFQPVADILVEAGDEEAVEALFTLGAGGNAEQQRKLAERLATLRSEHAIEAMLDNLRAKRVERRLFSARVLGDVVDPEVAEALAKQLRREKELDVSLEIVEALGSQQGEDATEALLRVAKKKGPLRGAGVRALARMGLSDPEVQRFLVGLMDGRSWQDKIFAIDAAAASGDVGLGRDVLPNLDDKQWEVRLATVQALRKLRAPDWVRPLIQRLGKEDRARVRYAIAETLFELTGVSIYTNYPAWERWWSEQGDSFQMPAMVPTRTSSGQGQTVSGFYGLPVDSHRLIFVIDQSGSMSARDTSARAETMSAVRTRLQQAVVETLNAVAGLDDDAWVNVILFESSIRPWKETIEPLTKSNRKDLEAHLRRQNPMGGTNLYDGLELALMDPDVDTIILLSDGMPGGGKYTGTQDILRAVERINQTRRITIHCVSLGRDSALLEQLAAQHGGRYVRR